MGGIVQRKLYRAGLHLWKARSGKTTQRYEITTHSGIRMESLIKLVLMVVVFARDTRRCIVVWKGNFAQSEAHEGCPLKTWRLSELMSPGDFFPKTISEQDSGILCFILRELGPYTPMWKRWGILSVIFLPSPCVALTHSPYYGPFFFWEAAREFIALSPHSGINLQLCAFTSLPVKIHL